MQKIKVLIVDDHRLIRRAISTLLNNYEDDIEVVGEADDEFQCHEIVALSQPDVILMDISLEDADGIELTKEIVAKFPRTKVIILSMHLKEEYIKRSVQAGAYGYVLKNSPHEELLNAVKEVYKGGRYFAQEVSRIMALNYMATQDAIDSKYNKGEILTKRELQIVRLILEGLNNQKIANQLSISHRTVDTHRTNIMQKVKVKNVAELVMYAVKNKLVEI
ncbi:MAG: response regulator [Flavobacteriales bacterium]